MKAIHYTKENWFGKTVYALRFFPIRAIMVYYKGHTRVIAEWGNGGYRFLNFGHIA